MYRRKQNRGLNGKRTELKKKGKNKQTTKKRKHTHTQNAENNAYHV